MKLRLVHPTSLRIEEGIYSQLGLTNPISGDITRAMTERFRSLIAVTLALSVFAILVSPFAASELTTLRQPHRMTPPAVAIPLSLYAPLAIWLAAPVHGVWEGQQQLVVEGTRLVDLTCARLC